MRRRIPAAIVAAFFVAPLSLAAHAVYAGQDVPLEQLPAGVRATVERETKGGQVIDIEKDHEAGKDVFEVEFTLNGKKYELHIAPDGTLIEKKVD
jgi:hypothetical protein